MYYIVALHIANAPPFPSSNTFNHQTIKSLKFREKFIKCLTGHHMPNAVKKIRADRNTLHYLQSIPPMEEKSRPTKTWRVCTQNKKPVKHTTLAQFVMKSPVLCVEDCFKKYHQ